MFALISLGIAIGKNWERTGNEQIQAIVNNNSRVVVYYLHATFRCTTCTAIETMTKELLDSVYGDDLKAGTIAWEEIDFQENEAMAKRFEVMASCVVVASVSGGEIRDYLRLDDVWTLMDDREQFDAYIRGAIESFLVNQGTSDE
ncbi:MAG: hypothetical protein JW739_04770 [Opitutales bacterium]|nr:hypothetical protein [Opitutales bacterium]